MKDTLVGALMAAALETDTLGTALLMSMLTGAPLLTEIEGRALLRLMEEPAPFPPETDTLAPADLLAPPLTDTLAPALLASTLTDLEADRLAPPAAALPEAPLALTDRLAPALPASALTDLETDRLAPPAAALPAPSPLALTDLVTETVGRALLRLIEEPPDLPTDRLDSVLLMSMDLAAWRGGQGVGRQGSAGGMVSRC